VAVGPDRVRSAALPAEALASLSTVLEMTNAPVGKA